MKVFKTVLNAIYPRKCCSCGEIIDKDEFLCEYCYEMLECVDYSKFCKRCGKPKKLCDCNYRVFHFSACAAPFLNDGVAQRIMYNYKFMKQCKNAEFLANEMAKTVKTVYADESFDAIVCVPMHPIKRLKRGFNQSYELASRLSEILGIKIYEDLLKSKYRRKPQHKTSPKERFANVKDMYNFRYKIEGKRILLVDDIKTTGASLDACAKQLLLAGADRVCCLTGLTTAKEKGKK